MTLNVNSTHQEQKATPVNYKDSIKSNVTKEIESSLRKGIASSIEDMKNKKEVEQYQLYKIDQFVVEFKELNKRFTDLGVLTESDYQSLKF